jgi:hypothetical protein
MSLNLIFGGLLTLGALYVGTKTHSFYTKTVTQPVVTWGEQVGKSKYIQSRNGDASLATERLRRNTVRTVGNLNPQAIKETRVSSGSTTGAVETFMIKNQPQ